MEVSAVLITRNEEKNLPRVLKELHWCEEIVVVDSGSTDNTIQIAHQFGARVLHHEFKDFSDQKNFADQNASHNWILALDADEVPSSILATSLREIKDHGTAFNAYQFSRKAFYLGKWINHSGWYPDKKIRFYDRRRVRWTGRVHESITFDGAVGELDGDLLHYTCQSLAEHILTTDQYTTLAAREFLDNGHQPNIVSMVFSPPWAFVRSYFIKLGFLDGLHGFTIAFMSAFYVFIKHTKIWRFNSK